MSQKNQTNQDQENKSNRTLVISRIINAPRALVFKVWTDPRHIAQWWGPNGFTNTIKNMKVKPGGEWTFIMHGPDGTDYPNKIVYSEVVYPERLVYMHSDDIEIDPQVFHVTVTFEELDGKTKLTMNTTFSSAEELEKVIKEFGALEGGNQTLNKLEEHMLTLPNLEEFKITRKLKAPQQLVWEVWTQAQHLAQWWGPAGLKMEVAKLDLRDGGLFHYKMTTPDGSEMWGRFVFCEINAPKQMSFIVSFVDEKAEMIRHPMAPEWPLEILNILSLSEENGMTTLTIQGYPINANDIEEKVFASNYASMNEGFGGTFKQLEDYISSL